VAKPSTESSKLWLRDKQTKKNYKLNNLQLWQI